jgi:thiamine-phosphate pyrophosphorylase
MICLVTDRRRLSTAADDVDRLVDLVAAAARAGIDLVQVRERDLDARRLVELVRRCVAAAEGTGMKVLVNDRVDVAMAAGADGVHLRGDSIAAAAVRSLVGDGASVGRSVHGAEEAAAVSRAGGLDHLIFGTVYPTASKGAGHPVATLDELSAACRAAAGLKAGTTYSGGVSTRSADLPPSRKASADHRSLGGGGRVGVPVLAIGGMTVERAAEVARAGAAGIAGIGLFVPPAGASADRHLQTVAARLRRAFDTCEAVS